MGGQGSLMPVGSKGWPVEFEILKLLKRLMLVLLERCQNTQCIAVCCIWRYIATEQSGCPCWPLFSAKSANNVHMRIGTRPQSDGKRWPGLMNHVFFDIMWIVWCVFVTYLGNTWHQNALWEEGKPVEAVWCFGQCSAEKPWVLPSIWMLLWHVPPTQALLQTMYPLSWERYSLMAVASFSWIMCCATKRKCFRNGLRNTTMRLRCWLCLQIPLIKSNQASVGCAG